MIVVISGTNRIGSNTRKVAGLVMAEVERAGANPHLIDLREMPPGLFTPSAYAVKPPEFEAVQEAVLTAKGIVVVTPEYNGGFPGVLKVFIDMLQFPDSLVGVPTAFVGLAAGRWGALRAVEQLVQLFQYRHAHIYGRKVHFPGIRDLLDEGGGFKDPEMQARLADVVAGFVGFSRRLAGAV